MKPEMTGRQNITIMSMISGKSREEIDGLIPEIIAFSELGAVIDHPVRTYSRGMAMRLSFAVATSLQPEILLIDEWIGAGDERFRKKAQKRLQDMVTGSKGFILASHNTGIIKQYCARAIWLEGGKIKAVGPAEDVVRDYRKESRQQKPGGKAKMLGRGKNKGNANRGNRRPDGKNRQKINKRAD